MAIKEIIYTAVIIESERGWGQRVDEVREFDTEKERDEFIAEFNKKSMPPAVRVPDYYERAEVGRDRIRDVQEKK